MTETTDPRDLCTCGHAAKYHREMPSGPGGRVGCLRCGCKGFTFGAKYRAPEGPPSWEQPAAPTEPVVTSREELFEAFHRALRRRWSEVVVEEGLSGAKSLPSPLSRMGELSFVTKAFVRATADVVRLLDVELGAEVLEDAGRYARAWPDVLATFLEGGDWRKVMADAETAAANARAADAK